MRWLNNSFSALFKASRFRGVTQRAYLQKLTNRGLKISSINDGTSSEILEAESTTPLPFHCLPGPTHVEMLKNIWREGTDNYHKIVGQSFDKYGPIFKIMLPDNSPIVYINDPDDFERVFRADRSPTIRPNLLSSSTFYLKKGLTEGIQDNGQNWLRHRLSIAPYLLRPIEIQSCASAICDISDDSIDFLREGRNHDLMYYFYKWATESVAYVTFGFRIGVNSEYPDDKALSFINAAYDFFDAESRLIFSMIPFHKFFETPTLRRLYRALDTMWDITNQYIATSLTTDTKNMMSDSGKEKPYVQKLVNDNRHGLSKDEITQVVISLFSAGVDTTALTIVNVLYHLSYYPEVQQKLHEEIRSVMPNDEKPTHKQLGNMSYLSAVIKESLRATPTFPGTLRQLRDPVVLSGYTIPTQTKLSLSFLKSKDVAGRIYGDFETFRPERWLRNSTHAAPHPFSSMPFGLGARMCVGRRVAVMEISSFLVRLLQRFEVQQSHREEDKLDRKFRLVLEPDKPFNLTLKKKR